MAPKHHGDHMTDYKPAGNKVQPPNVITQDQNALGENVFFPWSCILLLLTTLALLEVSPDYITLHT